MVCVAPRAHPQAVVPPYEDPLALDWTHHLGSHPREAPPGPGPDLRTWNPTFLVQVS